MSIPLVHGSFHKRYNQLQTCLSFRNKYTNSRQIYLCVLLKSHIIRPSLPQTGGFFFVHNFACLVLHSRLCLAQFCFCICTLSFYRYVFFHVFCVPPFMFTLLCSIQRSSLHQTARRTLTASHSVKSRLTSARTRRDTTGTCSLSHGKERGYFVVFAYVVVGESCRALLSMRFVWSG